MRATTLLERQFTSIHQILHDIADDLTPNELTTRILPHTNLLAFDLWHIARTQDWALQTLVRGVPEIIDQQRWQSRGRFATHGIGVGYTTEQADQLARDVSLADILEYSDAAHEGILLWLGSLSDETLDSQPDVPGHLARYPIYLETAMREEVPWMFQQPPVWRCLSPAIGHYRDHLAQIELIKNQARAIKG